MLNDQRASSSGEDQDQEDERIRDIHALTPPQHPSPANHNRRREAWETSSHRSSALSMTSTVGENFTTISQEFNALVLAGSTATNNNNENNYNYNNDNNSSNSLRRIGEEDLIEETNPLAIVADNNPLDPLPSPRRGGGGGGSGNSGGGNSGNSGGGNHSEVSVHRVKKDEVESKISAWKNAKIAKINNRFKREDAIINGWENEQVQKFSSRMKTVERKLEEKRARALEKMENDIAKAHRKAEERRASAEAQRGTKVARVFEIANLMKAVGKAPSKSKRSFF